MLDISEFVSVGAIFSGHMVNTDPFSRSVIGLELLIMDIHSGHYAHVITSSHSSCIAHAYK